MRLKLDESLDVRLAAALRGLGHDVHTVLDEALGGALGVAVLAAARAELRTLVTLDLDFANTLLFPLQAETGIVVLRPSSATLGQVSSLLRVVLADLSKRQVAGRLFIASPGASASHSERGLTSRRYNSSNPLLIPRRERNCVRCVTNASRCALVPEETAT